MRTLTPSAFVLESLGGFLSGSNIQNSNLIANAMREIFTTPADYPTTEPISIGLRPGTVDLAMEHTGHVLRELHNGETDLINGQETLPIIGDVLKKFIIPLAMQPVTQAQVHLNVTLSDALIQHLIYFGHWYRMDHYPVELH